MRVITIIKFLLCFLLAILCSHSLAAPDSQLLRRLDIQRGLFTDSYQSFEIDEQSIIYVLQENTNAITRGVAVMIADVGVPILGQEGFATVATELNKIGWVTILLPAPDIGFIPTVDQEAAVNNDKTNDKTDTVTDTQADKPKTSSMAELDVSTAAITSLDEQAFVKHEQQLVSFLQAAIEKSQEYPGFFLVISKGTSAAWLTKVYAEKTLAPPDAFVAISPYWPDRERNQRLPEWMANTSMPVLDLHSEWDNSWARKTATQREIAAVKSLKLQYRQRELIGFNIHKQHGAYITKEIYGWLIQMGL